MSETGVNEMWRLYTGGGELVAELEVTERDFPWLYARLHPRPGFEPLRPLFVEEQALAEDEPDDAWEDAYDRIRAAVELRYPDGGSVPEFILHIDGDDAWWRWSDEPFGDDGA